MTVVRQLASAAILGLVAGACAVDKSSTPLSPTVAGPLPGVTISAPGPIDPPKGSVIANQPVTLGFAAATSNSPRPFWYELQISRTTSFATPVHEARIEPPPSGGRVTYQVPTTLAPEQTYYWRVRAADGANTGAFSEISQFELVTPVVLQAPVPVSPSNGVTVDSRQVTVTVTNAVASGPVGNPIVYRFDAALDPGFSRIASLTVAQGSAGTTSARADLQPDLLYYWRARASTDTRAGVVVSPWSATRSFRTPPGPGAPSGDQLDLSQVTWLHRNVSGWPVTSTVTDVTVDTGGVCVRHTKAGQFPTSVFGDILVEGNVWIFANIGGRWYGATWDWLRVGQVCKAVTADEFGRDQIRIPPMDASWVPRRGDQIGFMISTRARDSVQAGEERTNVVMVTWPY